MNCYLCNSSSFAKRKGLVRDAPELNIFECCQCGLVFLSNVEHMRPDFYENSGMHGSDPVSVDEWLKNSLSDDQRRFEMLRTMLPNRKLLDFGCGAAGFLLKAQSIASDVAGIELERRIRDHWSGQISLFEKLDLADGVFDVITAFHVIEHLVDPRTVLRELSAKLAKGGRLVIEVPNADDVLLTLFDNNKFQKFTYWSQHLYLFNADNLRNLSKQAGLHVVAIQQHQRYSLSNHLHWLSRGKPGGHQEWAFLDNPELMHAYANTLASIGKCDTLIAHLELAK